MLSNCLRIKILQQFTIFLSYLSLSIAELFRDFLEAVHTQMDINIVYLPTWKFVFDFQMQHLLFTSLLFKTLCSNQIVNKTKFKSMGLENNGENIFDAKDFLIMTIYWCQYFKKKNIFLVFCYFVPLNFPFHKFFFPFIESGQWWAS